MDSLDEKVFRLSTHGATVADAGELARALKRLPRCLVIFGIEGKCFQMGCGVSLEVRSGADHVADTIERELLDAEGVEKMRCR